MRGWNDTRWIVLSSGFFGIPGVWYFAKHWQDKNYIQPIIIFSVFLIIACIVSVMYWYDAKMGWRRDIDLVVSKITFATACYCAFWYVSHAPTYAANVTLFPLMVYTYYKSSDLVDYQNDREWVKYHFAFHFLLGLGSALTLRGMEMNNVHNFHSML